ncbi:MAG: glycerol kinase GlpK [Alphaproteobacteria bacterium]|nr:glycerol kinase GlpK [Alphaproteobacteria bacterium]
MSEQYILSIDQGTTSSRALAFNKAGQVKAVAQSEFRQIFPDAGWVEHDAIEIWDTTLACCKDVLADLGAENFVAIAITNQRETAVVWERATGRPIANAIVWQDRRTADICNGLKEAGHEAMITEKTGLLLDPYFSASKVGWLLDNVEGASGNIRARAEAGELAFGTIDSWLVWQLTEGASHVTDASNAARTSLFNIHDNQWDADLLDLFGVSAALMPEVKDNAADFGTATTAVLGVALPILGMAGDQQAATIGQACFKPGMIKSTYGTGCFVLANTGHKPAASGNRLLTTIGYRLKGETTFALEGSIFMAGAIVQWLRDGLQLIDDAAETQKLAEAANPDSAVTMVPAFTGLGAPHWAPDARAAIFNMTRDSGKADIARAALESVSLQTADLMRAIADDMAAAGMDVPPRLRVDGGMVANDWLCQNLADLCACPIDRPAVTETTALGAAMLAMLQLGWFDSLDALGESWALEAQFEPQMAGEKRAEKQDLWQAALQHVLTRI